MKRSHLSSLLGFLFVSSSLTAAVVSPKEAQQIAKDYMSQQTSFIGYRSPSKPLQLQATRMKKHSDEAAYYVYGAEDAGFVIVSADDRTRPVLGHVYQGSYDEERIPANMRVWLDYLADQISNAPEVTYVSARKQPQYTTVSPLLEKEGIHWGQNEPFNNNCPSVNDEKCPSGCVATAAAQIMRYYKYPTQGRGSHSYEWNGTNRSSNFAAHTYDWNNMPAEYNKNKYTETQAKAVALLMSDVGISCNMKYAPGGSASGDYSIASALVNYFKYDSAIQVIKMDYIGTMAFEDKIATELKNGRPVMMSGQTIKEEGHEFVCDGVNSSGLFHINWGWDGWCNGDFAITALLPEDKGTGGGTVDEPFNYDVTAIIGIQKDKGNAPAQKLSVKSFTVPSSSVGRNEAFKIVINNLENNGLFTWTGYVGLLICDADYNVIDIYALNENKASLKILEYYPTFNFGSAAVKSTVPNGTYKMLAAYTASTTATNKKWYVLRYRNGEKAEFDLEVKTNSVSFSGAEEPKPETIDYIGEIKAEEYGSERMRFSWEAPLKAKKYVVNVFSGDEVNDLLSSDTVTTTAVTVRFYYPGKYKYGWTVRALDANNKSIQIKEGEEFIMEVTTDYTPKNPEHKIQSDGILYKWSGNAPAYQFELYINGTLEWRQFPTETQYFIKNKKNGKYEWNVRAVCQSKKYLISEAVSEKFTISNQALDETEATETTEKYIQNGQLYIRTEEAVYDVLGR